MRINISRFTLSPLSGLFDVTKPVFYYVVYKEMVTDVQICMLGDRFDLEINV